MNENHNNAWIFVRFKNTFQYTECTFKLGVRLSICIVLASHVVTTWYMLIMKNYNFIKIKTFKMLSKLKG